ncbi:hypothetical protein K488DRAFT_82834 [Vararia minispora EC-137]|uniref:Uncharacterized protein n=1 Tax=Vararia minispora EC-137 TaxID=1314806 RepID=A0ACB8QVJ4_9AGAM|nr:hypothetical protein K488DRAFT_82834 [Vararia minispora EC-137]
MVFLRWVRTGVLTLSVVLSAGVLALSALLIYTRSTELLIYFDTGDDDAHFASVSLQALAGNPVLRSAQNTQQNGGVGAEVLNPSGHDIDTILTTSVAIVNILTVPALLLADLLRKKTWVSTLIFEASWLFVLWSLWLTCAAYTAWCSQVNLVNFVRQGQCLQYKFVEVLSFINWISPHNDGAVMLYTNTLFTLAIINHMRRHPIWFSRVRDAPRLPPLVFATHPPMQLDEGKAHSLSLSASSSSLLHHPTTTRYSHGHSQIPDPHSPLLPSIDESSAAPPSPSVAVHEHAVARTDAELALPPTYTERPEPAPA